VDVALARGPLDETVILTTVTRHMPATLESRLLPGLLRRVLALGCAALVLALTVFAASPSAHASLHDDHPHHNHHHADSDEGCAIVMFASGVSLPVAPFAITPPTRVVQGISPVTAAEVFLVSPRYLRQPERGPPSSWVS
jgi:hypothetical protein